jgi:hypothetical protein
LFILDFEGPPLCAAARTINYSASAPQQKIIVILKLGRSLPELKDLSQSIVTKHRLRRRSH